MKQKIIMALLGWVMMSMPILAQNSIDRLVDKFSSVGSSTFTSAVERDPKTRKVVKVVKTLELEGDHVKQIWKAFEAEARNGNMQNHVKNGVRTMILTVKKSGRNRIYMLKQKADMSGYPEAKVTIIIKYNN